MPVRKITEQQFRTRRKDRKMVWVDAAALVVGLLVLAASVGGVIYYEVPPEPIEWEYSFVEGKVSEKICMGYKFGGVKEGCVSRIPVRMQAEGETLPVTFNPLTAPNVTSVVFTLTWVDETPEQEDENDPQEYSYTEESTDTLRLEVTTPWGETFVNETANDVATKAGSIQIVFDIQPLPEGGIYKAFEQTEVHRWLQPQHTDTEHKALGDWSAQVTVVRAGDLNGTAPHEACSDLPPEAYDNIPDAPQPVGSRDDTCDLDGEQDTLEGRMPFVPPPDYYQSSWVDEGQQSWILDFSARTWNALVTF